jgi:hypothetical protein
LCSLNTRHHLLFAAAGTAAMLAHLIMMHVVAVLLAPASYMI